MDRPLLAYGARGYYVTEMKGLLKKRCLEIDPSWDVDVVKDDDKFETATRQCVLDYQHEARLVADGMVGSNTWAALLKKELYNAYAEPNYVPAPDEYTCWAAATAMLKGESSPNTTRPPGVTFEQKNGTPGGLENSNANMQLFANYHGLKMVDEPNFGATDLCLLVTIYGRLMLNVKGVTPMLKAGKPSDSHLVILSGLRGDGSPSGTTLRIHNPTLRDKKNQRIVASFVYLKGKYPGLTYQTFYRITGSSKSIP